MIDRRESMPTDGALASRVVTGSGGAAPEKSRTERRVVLVRHGLATGGWDVDPDPPLATRGRQQAEAVVAHLASLGPRPILCSPMRRCRETAEPLARHWNSIPIVEPRVTEIPSPLDVAMDDRVIWLRTAMESTWTDLGPRYTSYRDAVVAAVVALEGSVIFSHFIAINAVIGAAMGDDSVLIHKLDNCSRTVFEIVDGAPRLVSVGDEADTVVR